MIKGKGKNFKIPSRSALTPFMDRVLGQFCVSMKDSILAGFPINSTHIIYPLLTGRKQIFIATCLNILFDPPPRHSLSWAVLMVSDLFKINIICQIKLYLLLMARQWHSTLWCFQQDWGRVLLWNGACFCWMTHFLNEAIVKNWRLSSKENLVGSLAMYADLTFSFWLAYVHIKVLFPCHIW